jgi:hypothetical protein
VISGWKLAAGVDWEVGQTTTVDRASRSLAWTTTANRLPRWTCPRRRGSVIAWTSPRTTKLLHQCSDLARLCDVGGIGRKSCGLRSQSRSPSLSLGSLGDRLARCLRARHVPPPCDLVERA